ncbi:hypothetical protein L2E82_31754 [Cichorium intybus]|uniref:Uncharacterized protein n=1 Tax=Cichorium intybus TaxID=13427 RepID=A0ACB9BG54_CICIN|nr:hypothetical protein L2E82_31754 [Cichorium intybus]
MKTIAIVSLLTYEHRQVGRLFLFGLNWAKLKEKETIRAHTITSPLVGRFPNPLQRSLNLSLSRIQLELFRELIWVESLTPATDNHIVKFVRIMILQY